MADGSIDPRLLVYFSSKTFTQPRTLPIDINACIGGDLEPETRELLQLVTSQRAKLEHVLNTPQSDPRNVAAAVDAYVPSLWRLTSSLEASGGTKVIIKKKPVFSWTSTLARKPNECNFGTMLYDVAMCLCVRATAHRETARVVLAADPTKLVEASHELRTGAGLLEFVALHLLPRWIDPPATRPVESMTPVANALAATYLADAQRVACAKGVMGGTSPLTLAKLLMGAADKYEYATRCLQRLAKSEFDNLSLGLLEELGAWPPVLRALAAHQLALSAFAAGEYGRAAGFAMSSHKRLQDLNPGSTLAQSPFVQLINAVKTRVGALYETYRSDCDNVYYAKIPADLGWPAAGAFIAVSKPYELPQGDLVTFEQVYKEPAPAPEPAPEKPPKPAAAAAKPASGKGTAQNVRATFDKLFASSYVAESTLSSMLKAPAQRLSVSAPAAAPAAAPAVAAAPPKLEAPPGVDPEVFASLPLDLQQEILGGSLS